MQLLLQLLWGRMASTAHLMSHLHLIHACWPGHLRLHVRVLGIVGVLWTEVGLLFIGYHLLVVDVDFHAVLVDLLASTDISS